MSQVKVINTADGGRQITITVAPNQISNILHNNLNVEDVAKVAVEALENANYNAVLKDAAIRYKEAFDANGVDGSLTSLGRESELIAWMMAETDYENAQQKVDRLEFERQEKIRIEEERKEQVRLDEEQRLADLAAEQENETTAEAELEE